MFHKLKVVNLVNFFVHTVIIMNVFLDTQTPASINDNLDDELNEQPFCDDMGDKAHNWLKTVDACFKNNNIPCNPKREYQMNFAARIKNLGIYGINRVQTRKRWPFFLKVSILFHPLHSKL